MTDHEWETHGWTAEKVRGYDWRTQSNRLHPQQHIGVHYVGEWKPTCRQCMLEEAALHPEDD